MAQAVTSFSRMRESWLRRRTYESHWNWRGLRGVGGFLGHQAGTTESPAFVACNKNQA